MNHPDGQPTSQQLRRVLVALCITEITSWGVLYYAFPVMLSHVTSDTGWSTGTALSAYSCGLLTSAMAAPLTGRLLDRHGPRPVMSVGSVLGVLALGAVVQAGVPGRLGWFFAAWVLVGLAQSALLYPPAFAALTRWYGPKRIPAITILSLVAGLASTVFAPSTSALLTVLSWRQTYLVLAVVLAAVTIPLHALLLTPPWRCSPRTNEPRPAEPGRREPPGLAVRDVLRSRQFLLLVSAMALAGFGLYGATLDVVPLLTSRGVSTGLAATTLGLVGAGQVMGRIGYPTLTRHTNAATRTALILAVGAVTVAALGALSGPIGVEITVAICAGAARGAFTLLQATAVSDRWGVELYPVLNGIAIAPATASIAISPAGTALLADLLHSFPLAYLLLCVLILAGAALAIGTRVTSRRR